MSQPENPVRAGDLRGRLLKNRYRIEEELGRGGMGSVVLAQDEESFGRRVVIKVPHARFLDEPGFRERFEREVRSLLNLEHPHIVKVLDAGSIGELPFMVLQHLSGGSLANRLGREGRLAPLEVTAWLRDIAGALDFIHKKGTLHRDVKPGNVLFDEEGHVYLADFGIAKTLAAQETALTQTGHVAGSPDYMAPEAGHSPVLSPAYDQYALAVLVYEALSGRKPHEGASSASGLLAQKMTQPPKPLGQVAQNLPAAAADAVMKALSMDPQQRHASCRAFAQAFEAGLQTPSRFEPPTNAPTLPRSAGSDTPTVAPDAPTEIVRKRRPRRTAVVGLLLLLVLATGGAYLTGFFDPPPQPEPFLRRALRQETLILPGGVALDLRLLPAGDFVMGCAIGDLDCEPNETPPHPRQVESFWIGRFEVTQRQWQAVMGTNPAHFQNCGLDCPVESVSWDEVQTFLTRTGLGLRLPTETEWEYAARGGSIDVLPTGPLKVVGINNAPGLDPLAWYGGNSGVKYQGGTDCSFWPEKQNPSETCGPQPVGGKQATGFGLFDVLGNVAEWCQDPFLETAYRRQPEVEKGLDAIDLFIQPRVVRGGSWEMLAKGLRLSEREQNNRDQRSPSLGFRVARSEPAPATDPAP